MDQNQQQSPHTAARPPAELPSILHAPRWPPPDGCCPPNGVLRAPGEGVDFCGRRFLVRRGEKGEGADKAPARSGFSQRVWFFCRVLVRCSENGREKEQQEKQWLGVAFPSALLSRGALSLSLAHNAQIFFSHAPSLPPPHLSCQQPRCPVYCRCRPSCRGHIRNRGRRRQEVCPARGLPREDFWKDEVY